MKEIMRTAGRLEILFKVVQWLVAILIVVMVVVAIVLTVLSAFGFAAIGEGFRSVDIGPLTLELSYDQAPDKASVLVFSWSVILLAAAASGAAFWACGCIRKILKPMAEGNPFHATVSDNIKRVGYAILIWGVVRNLGGWVEASQAKRYLNLEAVGNIRSVSVNYSLDLSFLPVFFLMLLVSYIFRYGTELQKLSDETL